MFVRINLEVDSGIHVRKQSIPIVGLTQKYIRCLSIGTPRSIDIYRDFIGITPIATRSREQEKSKKIAAQKIIAKRKRIGFCDLDMVLPFSIISPLTKQPSHKSPSNELRQIAPTKRITVFGPIRTPRPPVRKTQPIAIAL